MKLSPGIAPVGATLASLLFASPAAAQHRFIDLSIEDCGDLRPREVQRVLELELASVSSKWDASTPLGVELSCQGERVRVRAVDPVTSKTLTREVNLDTARQDRERTLALVVSQLFLTSWTELLVANPRPETAPPEGATSAVRDVVRERARSALELPSFRTDLGFVFGPRVRSVFSAPRPVGGRIALRPTVLLGERVRVFVEVGYERGWADQTLGTVTHSMISTTLGLAGRWPLSRTFGFEAGAAAGPTYVLLSGDPNRGATGTSTSGFVADAGVFAGPTIAIGGIARIALELGAGLTFPRAVGRADRGDDVAVSGAWLGANVMGSIGMGSR